MKIIVKKGNTLVEYSENAEPVKYLMSISKYSYKDTRTESDRVFELVSHICTEVKSLKGD